MSEDMGEVLVVNLFLFLRVLLVGGIFIIFPRITRKGLFFGVYVGEEFPDSGPAKSILKTWVKSCLAWMATALGIGLVGTLAGSAVWGNLTGTAVLIIGLTALFFRTYGKVKKLKPPSGIEEASRGTATLQIGSTRGEAFAKVTLVICLLVALGTLSYAYLSYPGMAESMPTLWSLFGGGEGTTEVTYLTILYLPGWNLLLAPLFALLALMVSTAKRSLREGPGNRSAEAQEAFRNTNAILFSGNALFMLAMLTTVSLNVLSIGRGRAEAIWGWVWLLMVVYILSALAGLVVLFRHFGQGGSRIERGYDDGALTGGLADNDRWVGGVFYVNPDDPSLMVESRFGIGYAMNWGQGLSIVFATFFGGLTLTLIALGFFL
jgi:uncharacterized membrane protein